MGPTACIGRRTRSTCGEWCAIATPVLCQASVTIACSRPGGRGQRRRRAAVDGRGPSQRVRGLFRVGRARRRARAHVCRRGEYRRRPHRLVDPGRSRPEARLSAGRGHRPTGLLRGRPDQGDRHGAFYEGLPVPGVRLNTESYDTERRPTRRAPPRSGRRCGSIRQPAREHRPDIRTVTVIRPERKRARSQAPVATSSPSRALDDRRGHHDRGRRTRERQPRAVDRDRLEREIAGGKLVGLDPAGEPIAGDSATLTFFEVTTHRVQTGTRYDFIEKKVVPAYEYETTERVAGSPSSRLRRTARFRPPSRRVLPAIRTTCV